MAEISKPDFTYLWSSGGSLVAPSNTKIQTGWTAEVPPFQWENWSQNRQDQAIAHVLQHGISVWDNVTEYQAGKSYVQGSDGFIYKSLTTNTNINPTTDGGTNWVISSVSYAIASTAQAQAWTSNTTLVSPLRLEEAFKGSNQSLTPNGYQKLPGGLIEQWVTVTVTTGSSFVVNLPITFPTACVWAGAGEITEATGNYYFSQVAGSTASTLSVAVYGGASGAAPTAQNGQVVKFYAKGY